MTGILEPEIALDTRMILASRIWTLNSLYAFISPVSDDMIEAHVFDNGKYKLVPGYPRLMADEYLTSPLPYHVNAAAGSQTFDVVFLLQRDDVFQYSITGQLSTEDLRYTFIKQFNMLNNQDVNNPFRANTGSSLPAAPKDITAMIIKADLTKAIAFSGFGLYMFNVAADPPAAGGSWEFFGSVRTPCA